MEFIFLGTSSGAPTKTRNVSGIAIKKVDEKSWCLVDCGEGTQHQILHTNLSLSQLDTIFITHVHGDHCFGLPGLVASATMGGRQQPLTIVCPREVTKFIEVALEISQGRLSFPINYIDVANVTSVDVKSFDVEVSRLSHRVPSFAFHFIENNIKPRLNTQKLIEENIPAGPVWGVIQSQKEFIMPNGNKQLSAEYLLPPRAPRKIIMAGDNDTPGLLEDSIKTVNVLVHEATFTEEVAKKVGAFPQHSSASSVAQFAEKFKLPNLVLTHFSSRYQDDVAEKSSIKEIEDEALSTYNGTLFLASDFSHFHLTVDGQLVHKQLSGN